MLEKDMFVSLLVHSMLSVALNFICEASYVKEIHRECHKIVINYVDIGVEYIYIKNVQKMKTFG